MKITRLVILRRIIQAFFLFFFLFLLIESRLPLDSYGEFTPGLSTYPEIKLDQPVTFFFKIDPLIFLSSLISGHYLITGIFWAIGIIILTLLFGRFFCGFVCPFGTIHHLTSRIKPALKGGQMIEANSPKSGNRIKYFILISILAGAVLGLNTAGFLDPISLTFRSIALAILPGIGSGIREFLQFMAASDSTIINHLSYKAESLLSPIFGYDHQAYNTAWLIGIVFLSIVYLNRIRPRFWCRYLCPLGALLGILAKASLLRLHKNKDKCTECGICLKECQGAAEPIPGRDWLNSECLLCFNCSDSCPENALSFKLNLSRYKCKGPDMGRRAVLGGLLAGISIPLLGRLDGRIYRVSDSRLIRPPGSLKEQDFLRLCQRCGLCMKVCPTNAINPTLGEAGMAGFWTPYLLMKQGYCEYTCVLCGSVCPTGAISNITVKEKVEKPVRIGSAYLDRGRCLPWSGNGPCIVCEEHCPTSPKAIRLETEPLPGSSDKETILVQMPYVDLDKCVGCGICENKCPIRGKPAIKVIAAGESRSSKNQILLSP